MGKLFNVPIIGIDPGSEHLRLVHKQKVVFHERNQISVNSIDEKVSGIGNTIQTGKNDKIIKPINGVMQDFHAFEELLRKATSRLFPSSKWFPQSFKMYFSVPITISETEKRAYRDVAEHAQSIEAFFVQYPVAAAMGAGIPLTKNSNFILIDIGAGKTEITLFADGAVVSYSGARFGGNIFFEAVQRHIKRTYQLHLPETQKQNFLGRLEKIHTEPQIHLEVYNTEQRFSKSLALEASEILHVLEKYLLIIDKHILQAIEDAPNEKLDAILSGGIFFTGGLSANTSFIHRFSLNSKISYKLSNTPLLDISNGLIKVLSDLKGNKLHLSV